MGNLKTYNSYKNTGIEWLPVIPEHWQIKRAKRIFAELSIKGYPNEPLLAATQTKGVVLKSKYENRTVVAQNNLETLKLVEPGNFVISLRSFQGGIELAYDRGIISPAYTVLRLKEKNETGYFKYLLKSKEYINSLTLLVTGIREGQNIDTNKFKESLLFTPSSEEQTAIARFLDYKLAKINRFIRKKKQLIKLLNEQKAAIINQAVTKGLDPNVKMKDSGIEWLGEIPEHWEVRKLKYVAKVKTGKTPKIESSLTDYFSDGNINWFTPGDFKEDGILSDSIRKINYQAIDDGQVSIFPENTVYLIGIGGTIGKVGISFIKSSSNQQINSIIFNELVTPLFGFYYLKTQKHQIDLLADFTTLPILNQAKNKEIIIAFPSLPEQQAIISQVEKETAILNTTISNIDKEIALVEEYKTALIAEAVTGKIDVRGYGLNYDLNDEMNTMMDEPEEEMSMAAEDGEEYQTDETE